jgi:hypothetical protein
LPDRSVEVTRISLPGGDVKIIAKIRGQASAGIQELSPPREADASETHKLRKPLMRMTLVHETESGPLRRVPLHPGAPPDEVDFPTPITGLPEWTLSSTIGFARRSELGPGRVYAYIEEIERRMPATYPREPVTVSDMFQARTFVDSGPRFAAKVEID